MANIIKRVWNQNRMVQIEDLKGMTFQAEQAGHTFQISGIDDDGNMVALTGTPAGVLLRPDNTDVALTCSVSGGVVSATLPANCYDVPGRFGLTIFITSGSSKTAIYAAVGTVTRTSSGTAAPGTTQSVIDLINAINAAINSIPASYSALLADIAPTYSNSALYSVGQYTWYDGDLKRCIVPITTAESYTAAHWTSAVLGQDVSDLKSAVIALNSNYPTLGDLIEQIVSSETSVTISTQQSQVIFDVTNGYVVKDGWQIKRWSVTAGSIYHINAENYNSEVDNLVFFFDSNGKLLWYTDVANNLYVVAPKGAAYAFANRNWRYSPDVQVFSCTIDDDTVQKIKNELDYIYSAAISTEHDVTKEFTRTLQVYAGIDSTGAAIQLVSADGGSYYQKSVAPYEKYIIDAQPDTGYKAFIVTNNSNHILAMSDASGEIVIPEGGAQLTVNSNWRNYTPTIYQYISGAPKINTITVKQSGGDFSSVKAAVESITDSSYGNRYNIEIHDGTYNIYNEFGGDTWFEGLDDPSNNMNGLYLPDYVNLIGVGDVTLTMRCSDQYATSVNVPLVSLLNLQKNNEIKNIKFFAKNVRYVVHDEANNQYHHTERLFENCYFEHEGNKSGTWYAMYALGCGSGNGNHYVYKQCVFKDVVPPYLMHNNVNQSEPTILEFYGCKFIDTAQNSSVYLSALSGSVAKCYAYFYDCQIGGGIYTAGTKWHIRGGGSTPFPHWASDTTDETVYVEMSDETTVCTAAASITRLQPLMLTGAASVTPLTSGNEHRFFGIALNDASSGDEVVVQYAGYVDINASGISANNGDAAYITGNSISIGTGTREVGFVVKEGSCFSIRMR